MHVRLLASFLHPCSQHRQHGQHHLRLTETIWLSFILGASDASWVACMSAAMLSSRGPLDPAAELYGGYRPATYPVRVQCEATDCGAALEVREPPVLLI